MSLNTSGFVECEKYPDLWELSSRVIKVLNTLKDESSNHHYSSGVRASFRLHPQGKTIGVNFYDGKDSRSLFICHCINEQLECNGLFFMLGAWGNASAIIGKLTKEFRYLGKTYIKDELIGEDYIENWKGVNNG